MRIPLPNPFARQSRNPVTAGAQRPPSPPRSGEPPHPSAAESSHSAYPPRLQQMRHVRALLNAEKGHMAAAKPGSEARRLHGKFVGYLKRYEQVLEHQGSSALRHAQDQVDLAHRNGRTDLARLQAALKPVEKDLRWADGKLAKLEGELASIERQIGVLGAQAKGDKGPIRFLERISPRGEVRRLAQLDSGSALGGLKSLFSRSPRLDKLTRDELQALRAEVQRDLGQVKGWKQEYEAERAGLMARPRLEAPRYPAVALPSREEILRSLHESQPLRKAPFVDPLAKPAAPSPATPAAPPLRSALRASGAASTGNRVTFAGDPAPPGTRPAGTPEGRAADEAEWAHLRFRLGQLRDEA